MTDGYTELAGGWCVPDSQMTGWPFGPRLPSRHYPDGILEPPPGFDYRVDSPPRGMAYTSIGLVPITAVRGGIKYPKGSPVAKTLNQQLATLRQEQLALAQRINVIERKVKARRTPPPGDQNAWTIDVRFEQDGKLYNYLILRTNGMYYTTGVQDSFFRTWAGLLEWLDATAGHSALLPLRVDYERAAPLEGRRD